MKKRTIFITTFVVAETIMSALFMLYLIVPLCIMSVYITEPYPGTPVNKTVEVPFTITFEADGEEKIYENSAIFVYDGWQYLAGTDEKENMWDLSFIDGNDKATVIENEHIEIYIRHGSFRFGNLEQDDFLNLYLRDKDLASSELLSEDEYHLYGIKNIEFNRECLDNIEYKYSLFDMFATKIS